MNHELYVLRRRHGDSFLTKFLDGIEVPWKPLSLEEFIQYDRLFSAGVYPVSQLEDEVFKLCCLDKSLVENIDELDAGIVTTTVRQIMEASGPVFGPEQISHDLNLARHYANDFFSQSVTIICQVFPGYKPEDVYALDYPTFMTRLAMAEARMLELGLLAEPLNVLSESGEEFVQEAPQTPVPSPRLPKKKAIQNKLTDLNPARKKEDLRVVGPEDIAYNMEAYDPHERQDYLVTQFHERDQLLDGLEYIYPDYLQLVSGGEKITPETIQDLKGRDSAAVQAKHRKYAEDLKSGKIKPEMQKREASQPVPKKKKKVVIRRVQ
jgi:hypothetical protein